jgi:hypothetical protein
VLRGGRPELYFFQLRAAAALALLVSFFVLLVKKLAVIGDFANRRIRRLRNFHQVEPSFARHTNGLEWLHDPELGSLLVNYPDLARPDPIIHAGSVALPEIPFCDISPSMTLGA